MKTSLKNNVSTVISKNENDREYEYDSDNLTNDVKRISEL